MEEDSIDPGSTWRERSRRPLFDAGWSTTTYIVIPDNDRCNDYPLRFTAFDRVSLRCSCRDGSSEHPRSLSAKPLFIGSNPIVASTFRSSDNDGGNDGGRG